MYICICNAITERQIVTAVELGARSTRDLVRELGVGLGCGRCMSCAKVLLMETVANVAHPPLQSLHKLLIGEPVDAAKT